MKPQSSRLICFTALCILLHIHIVNANVGERIAVCTADGVQQEPHVLRDGEGGVIVAWADFRAEAEKQIYAQRIDINGKVAWQADGLPISFISESSQIVWHEQVFSGARTIFLWQDRESNLYVQAVNRSGDMLWTGTGENQRPFSVGQTTPQLLADGEGGVFLFWWRQREEKENLYMLSIDLYVIGWNGARALYRNDGTQNNWLHINLSGVKSNKSGIGARIKVIAGNLSMIREVTSGTAFLAKESLTAEFGLGQNLVADSVSIRWPSGQVDSLNGMPANQIITVEEAETLHG